VSSLISQGYSQLIRKAKNQIDFSFRNSEQDKFFWSLFRNNCFSGGFGNGKTWIACLRQFIMLSTFPGYISLFGRQEYKWLKATTMKTFFKICPPEFVLRHDVQEGVTIFTNGSVALWLHLDAFDEQSLRGLEFNSGLLDQVEEIEESIYLVLDGRVGRWDGARVPDKLIFQCVPEDIWKSIKLAPDTYTFEKVSDDPKFEDIKYFLYDKSQWPKAPDGRFRVRNFLDVLCNPEDEFHWVYRRYHPDSIERKRNHFYIERGTDETLNDPETIENMKDRAPEWVDKYYHGKWGKSAAQIHKIHKLSIINPEDYSEGIFNEFLKKIFNRGALYRCLDHGETSPTCCLWFVAINNIHICFREYYVPDQTISFHREGITELSQNEFKIIEDYVSDIADPSIFHKRRGITDGSKNNFKTSIADEYSTDEIDAPSLYWSAGDNNELVTRNRINEWLKLDYKHAHPITNESPAPTLYFIKYSKERYPYGVTQAILQTQRQRREKIGEDNGKPIYCDNRSEGVVDHAYDPVRYYVAEHNLSKPEEQKEPPERSFAGAERIRQRNLKLELPGI